jgi:transmembrane sensor
MNRDLRSLLVEAEQQVQLPPAVERRLRQRILVRAPSPRSPWKLPTLIGVPLAAGLALVFALRPVSGPMQLDSYLVTEPSTDLRAAVSATGEIAFDSGTCTLLDGATGDRLRVVAGTKLRREDGAVRVIAGTVELEVNKRMGPAALARVLVSHGAIEVLGTRFTVVQAEGHGSVVLHSGEIRFRDLAGEFRAVALGERFLWPAAPKAAAPVAEESAPAAPQPLPKKTVKRPVAVKVEPIEYRDPEDLLGQVDVLRSRGLFAEAARYLTHGLKADLRPATRERFSYELGSILTYQLEDRARACAHWKEHLARYPAGRYQTEVVQASAHQRCSEQTP